ncbi:Rab3 GTPase-activating protein catalytic subunit [Nymphon striatum]|nr:Rab3 GTPase-activating protein catalytic subunit [Nymphon striatum]
MKQPEVKVIVIVVILHCGISHVGLSGLPFVMQRGSVVENVTSCTKSDQEDVFEITDFTTVSDWEKFIAQLEELIQEWKLSSVEKKPPLKANELTTGKWNKITETLNFVKFDFNVYHLFLEQDRATDSQSKVEDDDEDSGIRNMLFSFTCTLSQHEQMQKYLKFSNFLISDQRPMALADLMFSGNDFSPKRHCLVQWYGLRDFIVVQPNFDGIFTETKAKLLLSSATVALDNANCHIPIFIQVHNKDKDLFLGVCEHTNVRTYFDVAFLRRTPHIYKDLSGLTDLFKSKLCQQSMVHDNLNVLLSAKLTYTLSNWIDHPWPQGPSW